LQIFRTATKFSFFANNAIVQTLLGKLGLNLLYVGRLGSEELREFEQARNDYQQALQIKIEFGDRVVEVITEATDIRRLDREATPDYLEGLLE
jgi:hypothetical protein